MNDRGSMFLDGGFMWLIWLVIIAVVIYVDRIGMNSSSMNNSSMNNDQRDESPLEILNKRYAYGEIDEQEYKRRRNDLK